MKFIASKIFVILGCVVFISTALDICANPVESNLPDPELVKAVEAGEQTTANAAWWGFNEEDATQFLQSAIDSGAKKVIVPNMGKDWIVRTIKLVDGQEIVFEKGVVIAAKKGEFKGKYDCLFSAMGKSDITLRGYGATLRMQKKDYMTEAYAKAEWRSVLAFYGCSKIHVEGLTLRDSGGDGIYLGANKTGQSFCKDVVIKEVVCDNNLRQGITIISGENLLVEKCVVKNTGGTAPAAGLDVEPNADGQPLRNVVIRDCVAENNEGGGFFVYLKKCTSKAGKISVLFENCQVRGDKTCGLIVGAATDDGPKGLIEFKNCNVQGAGQAGILVYDKSAKSVQVRFRDCVLTGTGQNPPLTGYVEVPVSIPICLYLRRDGVSKFFGGVEFINCRVEDDKDRPFLTFREKNSAHGVYDLKGNIVVKNKYKARMDLGPKTKNIAIKIDQASR